ncbi:hypothetical protein ACETIH_22980 [Microvirga arabica]|uniref:Uncharacterized protein n=1 Tax=Microvirga arabica TaxID=1128671 RepID=A0ABV6YDZ1_9HYPH
MKLLNPDDVWARLGEFIDAKDERIIVSFMSSEDDARLVPIRAC